MPQAPHLFVQHVFLADMFSPAPAPFRTRFGWFLVFRLGRGRKDVISNLKFKYPPSSSTLTRLRRYLGTYLFPSCTHRHMGWQLGQVLLPQHATLSAAALFTLLGWAESPRNCETGDACWESRKAEQGTDLPCPFPPTHTPCPTFWLIANDQKTQSSLTSR